MPGVTLNQGGNPQNNNLAAAAFCVNSSGGENR